MSKVSIRSNENGKTLVFIDGEEIPYITRLEVKISPSEVPIVQLEIAPSEIEFIGELVEVVE
jgi:hypothetical protein